MDLDAILEWNCRNPDAEEIIGRVWVRAMDSSSICQAPWLGALWNDARHWLTRPTMPRRLRP